MTNFSFPYFSRDIAEFWRRWHISLSTWFRDYVYIPLGGSRGKRLNQLRNVMIVFLVSGFWHGANWTFIMWGLVHALFFIPLLLSDRNRRHIEQNHLKANQIYKVVLTFVLVTFAWIYFRADTITLANQFIIEIFSLNGLGLDVFFKSSKTILFSLIIAFSILVLIVFELIAVQKEHKEVKLSRYSAIMIVILICFMGVFKNPSDFIYFQF